MMVNHIGVRALKEINHFFKTKDGSIGDPDFFLGANLLQPITLPNGVAAWGMSSSNIQAAVAYYVEAYNAEHYQMRKWEKQTLGPISLEATAELDKLELLDAAVSTSYQTKVGVPQEIVELGQSDIITKVSELSSSFLAILLKGLLNAVFHILNHRA